MVRDRATTPEGVIAHARTGQGYSVEAHEVFGAWIARSQKANNLVVEDSRGTMYCWLYNRIECRKPRGKWREQPINDTPRKPYKLRKYIFKAREVVGKVVSDRGKEFVIGKGAGMVRISSKGPGELVLKAWGVTIILFIRSKTSETEWLGYKNAINRATKLLGKVSTERFLCR